MYDALQRGTPQTPPTPSSYEPPAPAPAAPVAVDPNLMYSNPAEYDRQLRASIKAEMQAELAGASRTVMTPMANMAKATAQAHRPEVWKRFAPEVETMMASASEVQKANPEVWKTAVDVVAGRHLDTLVESRARDLVERGGPDAGSLKGSAGPGGPQNPSLTPLRKLFADAHPAVQGYLDDRIPVERVIARAAAQGYSEEAYAKLLTDRALRRVGAA